MTTAVKKRPAGRNAVDGARNVERVTVTLEPEQRPQFRRFGGSAWLRSKIREEARIREEANVISTPDQAADE